MYIKRGNKTVLALEIAFLLIAVIYAILLSSTSELIRYPFLILILLFFCVFSLKHLGFKRDKYFLKTPTMWLIGANAIMFGIILGFIGVFTDFTQDNFSLSFIGIWQKIIPLLAISIEIELFRYIAIGKVEKNMPVLIAFALISSTIFLADIPNQLALIEGSQIPLAAATFAVRILLTSIMCTYLANHFGFLPALIYRLIVVFSILLLPIWPRLGWTLSLIIAIAFPFFTYYIVRHHEFFSEKNHSKARTFAFGYFCTPIIIILSFFAILNTGITGYETLAIASNSMRPTYSRGDIVIYKRNKPSEISVNDILVFKRGNRIITHRVVEIRGSGDDLRFIVKGDNNNVIDDYSVSADDIRGTVRVIGHYIGYPALLINGVSETEE